jgi:predicted HTH domain antitoxin
LEAAGVAVAPVSGGWRVAADVELRARRGEAAASRVRISTTWLVTSPIGYEATMAVVIPEDVIREAGLTEREALVEFACHLFDLGRLTLPAAARLAGLPRVSFEQELRTRRIAIYRPTPADLKADLDALDQLGI